MHEHERGEETRKDEEKETKKEKGLMNRKRKKGP